MKPKKIVNAQKLRATVVQSTMTSMAMEGRRPLREPSLPQGGTSRVVRSLSSSARWPRG